jgi:opacity protein-like surface antigen
MKRFIAAVSFAVLASSAFAADVGKPFEQLDIDRALPNLSDNSRTQLAATAGGTQSDVDIATDRDAVSPWANDQHFIAPPQ